MSTLKIRVSGKVEFVRFSNLESKQELWYSCEDGFEFPISLEETSGAEFERTDKAIYFMRWIRKHMSLIEGAKNENV